MVKKNEFDMREAERFGAMREKEEMLIKLVNGKAEDKSKVEVLKDLFPEIKQLTFLEE